MESEERLVVVFSDTRPALAQLLRNQLVEAGIEAFIENEELRQAAGDLPLGWATAPRVTVPERDLAAARQIVAEFTRETNQASAVEADAIVAADAPVGAVCPHCRRPRLAECPFCHTSGADFAAADRPPSTAAEEETEALLICPTCDEPFRPGYLRRCEWCGHDFGEGIELAPQEPAHDLNERVIVVALGLGLVLAGILAWFSTLVK